jgi:hypothetical protein
MVHFDWQMPDGRLLVATSVGAFQVRMIAANQSVERVAASGRRFQIRLPGAAAIAHFSRYTAKRN